MLRLFTMQAGAVIKQDAALDVSELINGLRTYIESTHDAKTLVQPVVQLHSNKAALEHAEEVCLYPNVQCHGV